MLLRLTAKASGARNLHALDLKPASKPSSAKAIARHPTARSPNKRVRRHAGVALPTAEPPPGKQLERVHKSVGADGRPNRGEITEQLESANVLGASE